jgi:hypothetical protein
MTTQQYGVHDLRKEIEQNNGAELAKLASEHGFQYAFPHETEGRVVVWAHTGTRSALLEVHKRFDNWVWVLKFGAGAPGEPKGLGRGERYPTFSGAWARLLNQVCASKE